MHFPFFQQIEAHISAERLRVYAVPLNGEAAEPKVTLSRYMLNMALCESLYPALQNCEIALRNAIHKHLMHVTGRADWYDDAHFQLTPWAQDEVRKAKAKLHKMRKPLAVGSVVSELQFGFWTSLFEAHYEQCTPFLPSGIKAVFPHLPKSLHKRKDRKNDLEHIRALRNRVFHHERILHWKDLDAQHALILQVIGWISPELRQLTAQLERFESIRQAGLTPFLRSAMWDLHQIGEDGYAF